MKPSFKSARWLGGRRVLNVGSWALKLHRRNASNCPSISERAGIADFRWHDLRHTFATWHRHAGTPTPELQRLGGWRTGAMGERHAHVAAEAPPGAATRLDAMR
ncbi:MAG: tyrosine-type recombinase/integrase [Vitreoscilla sp.]